MNIESLQGENGTIVIDAVSAEAGGDWRQTIVDGREVMLWDAASSNYGVVDPEQALSYSFVADETGTYYISMHSARVKSTMSASELYEDGGTGEPRTDTGNDVYVSIVDDETGEVLREPTKLFTFLGHKDEEFAFGTTFDAETKFQATIHLETGRKYRLELTGRSDGYALDMITLNNGSVLRDASLTQSPPVDHDSPDPTPNAAPVTEDDAVETAYDTTVIADVTANDTDADGDALTLTSVSYDGDTAIVTIIDGEISVNPLSTVADARVETIAYTVADTQGATDTGTLTVSVGAGTPEPIVTDETIYVSGDTELQQMLRSAEGGEAIYAEDYAGNYHINLNRIDGDITLVRVVVDTPPKGADVNLIFAGSSGHDIIFAGDNTDQLVGGGGIDRMAGGGGADLFIFAPGDGLNIVYDFTDGVDQIGLLGAEFDDLTISSYRDEDTLITLNDDRLILRNTDFQDLSIDDFAFL